ncbi:MAG: hypothetical protein EA391_01015 [Balneolaceae bacterium]|nr:MAG: hypothetical protein EA391_01015 [Balneolaceae bacterium]
MNNRIYTEEEVAQLIKRAVELEAERSISKEGSRTGLNLTDLEQIASEAGIDPELIKRAANELDSISSRTTYNAEANIKHSEIVFEEWITIKPDPAIFEDLITELNHRYGTSDKEITWWDKLWDDYNGKAKSRKTATSCEWEYTDEWGYFTTRALFQLKNDTLRVRISKRQLWDMKWEDNVHYLYILLPVFVVSAVIGGVLTGSFFDNPWLGISGGAFITAVSYPILYFFSKRSLQKHTREVKETASELLDLITRFVADSKNSTDNRKESFNQKSKLIDIEYISDDKASDNESNPLRNKLRES